MLPKLINISVKGKCIGILFILMTLLCLGACSPKHSSYSEFKDIAPGGWVKAVPCEFVPEFADSSAVYDVKVAFCYAHDYPYRNMSVVVDFVKADSLVKRSLVECVLTDENGNWQSAGFGVAYQSEHTVCKGVTVGEFDKILIWQGLKCDTLPNIIKAGVTISPSKR